MHRFCWEYTPRKSAPQKEYMPIGSPNVCRFLEEPGVCRFGCKTYPGFGREWPVGSMRCRNANWVVKFTTLLRLILTGLLAALEGEQCGVRKLMELPSSRCHRHCLKAMYDSMPRSRTEVDVSCTFTRHAGTLWES